MKITFEGNKKINATVGDFVIKTDQPKHQGGEESEPNPFQLFLASLGTCSGIFIKSFLDKRDISSDGITLSVHPNFNKEKYMLDDILIKIHLPENFDAKYEGALVSAAKLCLVGKHLSVPHNVEVVRD
ncbi:MAG: osmotically inducible protein OsmC [Elusimicrobiaceae bacterium]|jgi:putative redox protein|nr:osmotically inducible protein OsmC [Elusimicrobiaceae bacterium]MBT3955311.1 osmotically inducible protein OsmC [Elusimicrobiaceae bacterium]MBT4008447.1 osmotically inducible protein OsmC [Elusimicrobiaceae bacterium]MBT4403256.1 osmotically inducible protein OsmC [Elusimicrobiaceae bacterium]MBT4440176.1 osmotically inducible protein OsmC [Elusimicrobiaceae bacterium]